MNRRDFLKKCMAVGAGGFVLSNQSLDVRAGAEHPNILLITADDMNYDSPGVYGCGISDITPNIDRLAAEGLRFTHSHITIAVCQPSRSVLMTGRYPHRNGAEGFEPIDTAVPTLQEQLRSAGYINGIMAKNGHLAPRAKFCWDYYIQGGELGRGRDPSLYYNYARKFFEDATAAGKPFFLMANSQDPHRPFAGSQQEQNKWKTHLPYSRKITTEEAEIPGFLPELKDVRQEISEYFTSVHRCDQTVGQVLRALKDTGFEDNTLVMFLSDNGIALPFAKTNCYLNSTKTPWIVRWPGVVKPGTVDTEHFISGIDYMPTILDVLGLPGVAGMDGTSFVPLLTSTGQENRDKVFTVFHETSAKRRYEMRCVQNKKFGYIYNAWSDGQMVFKNESQSGLT
ncbi:MAG: sulfatase family protein, partial [Planctomycetota bacterium]